MFNWRRHQKQEFLHRWILPFIGLKWEGCLWCTDYLKMHLRVKNLNIGIYSTPRQNSPADSYHHPLGRGKLLVPPSSIFLENLSPSRREEETMIPPENVRKPLIFRMYRNGTLGLNGLNYLEKLNCRKCSCIFECERWLRKDKRIDKTL